MTLVASSRASGSISRAPRPSSLADVLDLILDKGLVIDAYVRVSVAGIEVLTIDARVVIASVDTYLRFAEAVNRLDLSATEQSGIEALTGSQSSSENEERQQPSADGKGGNDGPDRRRSRSASKDDGPEGTSERSAGGEPSDDADEQSDESDDAPGLLGRLAERAKFDQ